jgi:hypothetical protein
MWANHSLHSVSLYRLSNAFAVISGVGQEVPSLSVIDQFFGDARLMALSPCELDVERLP